ncbi:sialidase family protein [Cyclobacterium sp. 1_MG-2023]|uniref:sialidase family protein n=1 Tax=Cyclobacterium sp. 1_MG-2023 TaxID=3062681 RepID=UPI0026E303E5|nr:sialidase family protein [Cyclobacterium sp. 1_MG-2023]MDO6439429.1 sialidase family protein [Cyclobacterium sp. 1_MG-2023]
MATRRGFLLKSSVSVLAIGLPQVGFSFSKAPFAPKFSHSLDVVAKLFDGKQCWVHPRAGTVDGSKEIVMTMSTLDLEGSDVFKGMYQILSKDGGKTWTKPRKSEPLAPRIEDINGQERPVAAADFWPKWHSKTGVLLGIGHTIVYTPEWKVANPRPRHTAYSVYDPQAEDWLSWKKLEMPEGETFFSAGAGCVQRLDLPDGSILLPIYYKPPGKNSRVVVCHCSFDGKELRFLKKGNSLKVDNDTRGLHEPSLMEFGGKYFLTIRNDLQGYITTSADGLHYDEIKPWTFDDGSLLGNYNTQQHWVRHSDALYLVYTRKGADNDHVFRHRAPLFMAQVDTEKLAVIRDTEVILVPERGARLGNFGVTEISPKETWVTVSEWMQPEGVEQYGSDGSVYVAKIKWKKRNKLFGK